MRINFMSTNFQDHIAHGSFLLLRKQLQQKAIILLFVTKGRLPDGRHFVDGSTGAWAIKGR